MAAASLQLTHLELSLNYHFHDISRLQKALTAPGAEGVKGGSEIEQELWDGNRRLAQIGNPLYQFSIQNGASRQAASKLISSAKARLEGRARSLGLYEKIRLHPGQIGGVSCGTLTLVFNAIVGAVWEDCRNQDVVTDVVRRLYIDPIPGPPPHTTSLSGIEMGDSDRSGISPINKSPESGTNIESSASINADAANPRGGSLWMNDLISPATTEASHDLMTNETPLQPQADLDSVIPMNFCDSAALNLFEIDNSFDPMDYMMSTATDNSILEPLAPSTYVLDTPRQVPQITASPCLLPALIGAQVSGRSNKHVLDSNMVGVPVIGQTSALYFPSDLSTPGQSGSGVVLCKRKKLTSSGNMGKIQDVRSSRLRNYIDMHKTRCLQNGLAFLDFDYRPYLMQDHLPSPKMETHLEYLKTLYFAIGSPEALALLHELLKMRRALSAGQEPREKHNMSPADRMRAIEKGDVKQAYQSLRKRCHVVQLTIDCGDGSPRPMDGFVSHTTQSMASTRAPQIGNPQNLEISRRSNHVLSQLYPGLKTTDQGYEGKKRLASELAKLGQRLHLLIGKFGYGILGLLPLPSNEPTLLEALNLSDEAIIRIPENHFRTFLYYLESNQGEYLHAMSDAVTHVVEAIFNEEADETMVFPFENREQAEIIHLPWGSNELLQLNS